MQIAKELGSLAKVGRYVVRPLYYMEDAKDTGVWPTFFIPQTSISVGGVDQPYKPLKKRRVADASGAHVEVLARHRDEGAPDGEPYVSLNETVWPHATSGRAAGVSEPHQLTPFGSLCDCCSGSASQTLGRRRTHVVGHALLLALSRGQAVARSRAPQVAQGRQAPGASHLQGVRLSGAAADIVHEDLTVLEDDWKTQFWQFRVHPIELPTSTLYAWVELY